LLHLLALVGVVSISFSAVFVRLASVSPVTAAFFRAAYAVPPLHALWLATRGRDRRPRRARLLAAASGVCLAIDLALWHESIALIGVGLATVIANVQVVFVALAAWLLWRERPSNATLMLVGLVLAGIALTSGLARPGAYGSAPALGVVFGVLAGGAYSAFLLTFRSANRTMAPTQGPLLDSTVGTALGALLAAPLDARFSLTPVLPAHYWLVLLALVAQVFGWLLIATALPRLPALETSVLLLVQPVFTVLWGVVFFSERLSAVQWIGAVIVLAGVASITLRQRAGSAQTL
jgi:drug/metabolite transporter (DMT)-like permease